MLQQNNQSDNTLSSIVTTVASTTTTTTTVPSTTTTTVPTTTTTTAPAQDNHNEIAVALSKNLQHAVRLNQVPKIGQYLTAIITQGHWDYFSQYFARGIYELNLRVEEYKGLETFLYYLSPAELASTVMHSGKVLLPALQENNYDKTKQIHLILKLCIEKEPMEGKKAVEGVISPLVATLSQEDTSSTPENRNALRIISHYTDLECVQKLSIYPQIQGYNAASSELSTKFKVEEKQLYEFEESTIKWANTPFNTVCHNAFSSLCSSGNSSSTSNKVVEFTAISKNMLASLKAQPGESREKEA